jgi:TolB-like protein
MAWMFGEFRVDPECFELLHNGQPVRVEPQVLALLVHLIRHRDRMVTKDELADTIWQGRTVSDASIASRIRSVRQAVGDDGNAQTVIRTVHGRGFRFVAEVQESGAATAGLRVVDPTTPQPTRPSIAILPFRMLGSAAEMAILADAIPHEIIQALSRLRWLAVIARGSSFRFRQAEPDLGLVATALGARYVLSGDLELRGTGLSVTLALVDTSTDAVVWGDRLAGALDAIDDLRARIVTHLISALEVYIPLNEAQLAMQGGTEALDAWANYHLGLNHLYRFTAADTERARLHFGRAISMDPRFARAYAGLSFTSFLEAFLHLAPDVSSATQAARRYAERGVELDPLDPFANFTMGRSYWLTNEPDTALDWLTRATTLNPNYAQGFYASAFTSMLLGSHAETESGLDTALQLSPLDPLLYGIHGVRSQMLMQTGDYQAAARWGDKAAATPGAHYLIAMIALAANSLAGRHNQAARWKQEVLRRKTDASCDQYLAAFPTRDKGSRVLIEAELRRHGF